MDINNFSDQDLIDLKNKQDEKLVRYSKCYNEATERTINNIKNIEAEINRRKINKSFNPYSKEFKEEYIKYNNYID
jgi:flagellar biosynthesis chaperone FliJ